MTKNENVILLLNGRTYQLYLKGKSFIKDVNTRHIQKIYIFVSSKVICDLCKQ